jgi:hypothetical protein
VKNNGGQAATSENVVAINGSNINERKFEYHKTLARAPAYQGLKTIDRNRLQLWLKA